MNCNWIIECSDNSSQSRAFSISNFKISIKNNDFSRNTQNHKYWSSIISVKWKGKQADISSICENRVMSIIIASFFHIFSNQSCVSSLAFFFRSLCTYKYQLSDLSSLLKKREVQWRPKNKPGWLVLKIVPEITCTSEKYQRLLFNFETNQGGRFCSFWYTLRDRLVCK